MIMRILYVGDQWHGSTSLQRLQALTAIGTEVTPIDTAPPEVRARERRLLARVANKLIGPLDWAKANHQIAALGSPDDPFDVLWLDKGKAIDLAAIRQFRERNPGALVVGYSGDDMIAAHNRSARFIGHLHEYDVFFTTKSYHVTELQALGCRRVEFIPNSFDPSTHRPVQATERDREALGGPVGFIGDWENERANSLLFLAQSGISVRVWGWGKHWRSLIGAHPRLKVEGKALWGRDYARAICAFDINLAFLRKCNRDRQTTRSIEIPACGAFMLAERTEEHLALFEEGKEAAFFSDDHELLTMVRHYLAAADERQAIARRGRERCLASEYSNHARLKKMLAVVATLRPSMSG
jgi:spore maturation protein CgeB